MTTKRRYTGLTLPEMTVVISIAALMVGLTIPAVNMLLNSFESQSGAKSTISAALSSARAIAAKEQRYAGIRFQKRYDPANPDPINESQYIIFIIHDPNLSQGWGDFFRAVDGIQPIKLPDSIGVMDLFYNSIGGSNPDVNFANQIVLRDTTTFSIVFSPAGKLVIRDVRVRNRNGKRDSDPLGSDDDIFNKLTVVRNSVAMFPQDDYFALPVNLGLGLESSRNSFIIYETKEFKQAYNVSLPWSNYLNQLKPVFINPYTGTIINEK